jgi:hypothetical protein
MPFTIRSHHLIPLPCSAVNHAGPCSKLLLAFVLGCWLLTTLLVLSSGVVYAEWVLTSGNDESGLKVYIDPDSIRRQGNLAKMWQLYDYKNVQTVAGDSLLSIKRFNEYDCTAERTRMLGYTWFSGNMGSGSVVYSTPEVQPWESVGSRTINHTLWKVACDKK